MSALSRTTVRRRRNAEGLRRLSELAASAGPLPCSILAVGEPPRQRWLLTRDLLLAVIAGAIAGYVLANLALWSMP